MEREAVVVGINSYPMLDNMDLKAAYEDAKAIAQLLEKYGGFRVQLLPASDQREQRKVDPESTANVAQKETPITNQNRQRSVNADGIVKVEDLKTAIQNLFNPPDTPPDTALLFFAGHGFRQEIDGDSEGFLLTSDAYPYPPRNKYGLSLKWLEEQLEKSPVRQQIVWLDCCHSGEFLNFIQEKIKDCEQVERDRCFIAACRSFQISLASKHGLLTEALLEELKPEKHGNDFVTNYALEHFIKNQMAHTVQRPVIHNFGKAIILTYEPFENEPFENEPIEKPTDASYQGICPYRSLAYFTRHHKHAVFFYGREKLTQELINRVENDNFIAVLGASGSGKSSLLRAGLLYQLRLGQQIPGSDRWHFLEPFTPGNDPLKRLQRTIWRFLGVSSLPFNKEELKKDPSNMLTFLLESQCEQEQRMVMVIDQFEECFTMCQDEEIRKQFFDYLLKALEKTDNKLCIVIGMRSDFRSKLTEYKEFIARINRPFINVQHLNPQEIEAAIIKPAEKVGLRVERALVTKIVEDVEDYPGSLPLLEDTLTELWKEAQTRPDRNFLRLDVFEELGGIEKTLENRANKVYDRLSEEEKPVARRIFLELTQTGEATDTRRRVRLKRLENKQHSWELLQRVSSKLASEEARLITISEDELTQEPEEAELNGNSGLQAQQSQGPIVDIIHEALIRKWEKLKNWQKEYQAPMQIERRIEADASDWKEKEKPRNPNFLRQGEKLIEAENYLKKHGPLGMLDGDAQDFIDVSRQVQDQRDEEEEIRKRREKRDRKFAIGGIFAVVFLSVLGGAILQIYRKEKTFRHGHIQVLERQFLNPYLRFEDITRALKERDELQKNQNQNLLLTIEDKIEALKGAKELQNHKIEQGNRNLIFIMLQKTVYGDGFRQNNLLQGHDKGDGFRQNNLLQRHDKEVSWVSFSEDGKRIASASQDKTVKLSSLQGELNDIFPHKDKVNRVYFSTDDKMLASASYQTVNL